MKVKIILVLLVLAVFSGSSVAAGIPDSLKELPDTGGVSSSLYESRRTAIVIASEKASPAVVTVNTVQTIKRRVYNPFYSPFFENWYNDFFGPGYQEYEQEIPSMGSGFIFDEAGYVLTAEHVVHGADEIEIILPDGRAFEAEFVGSDYASDVAVLKIEGDDLPVIELGDSDGLFIGEWAIAIGNPFGNVVDDPNPTVSVGVVSATGREMSSGGAGGYRIYYGLIQTDASINPGNSGGPLVNSLGQAIGLNVTIITTSGGSLGIGFAVPINRARDVAREIVSEGEVTRAWIGVYLQEVTPDLMRAIGLDDDSGLLISDLDENGPAYEAHLRRGDVILEADGKPMLEVKDWNAVMAGMEPGATMDLRIKRNNTIVKGQVRTGESPGP
ncbi:MAG: trypsin-like serine protease [bacterium]|nr:trypsin-like serine protease [bacterium]